MCKTNCFRFKAHPGDLMRDTSVQKIPDHDKEQDSFWLFFHPQFQNSKDVYELNNLYKVLYKEGLDEDFIQDNDWYERHKSLDEEALKKQITADCFENFYRLLRDQMIEIL